jgi:hypothetical protein
MSHPSSNFDFWLLAGFGSGVYSFFKGFRVYREYRVVEDTPEVPIRSIAMGLVRIHGKACGDQLVTSPVSHSPCYFYKIDIEKWKSDGKSSSWSHYRTDTDGVNFYLEDTTGKVLVNAHNAEYDLYKSCKREVKGDGSTQSSWSAAAGSSTTSGATDAELLSYVNQASVKRISSWIERGLRAVGPQSDPSREQTRMAALEMFSHPPGGSDFVQKLVAAQAPRVEQKLAAMGQQSDPDKERARLEAIEAFKYPFGSPEFTEHMQRAVETQRDPEAARKFLAHMESFQRGGESGFAVNLTPASGRYRFTEYCILPDHWYDVTGTCVENPNAKDEHDRNLIIKGQNEPTFLISWKAEKQVESSLRRRAALYVFGGAALAVVCLGILLAKFGWL